MLRIVEVLIIVIQAIQIGQNRVGIEEFLQGFLAQQVWHAAFHEDREIESVFNLFQIDSFRRETIDFRFTAFSFQLLFIDFDCIGSRNLLVGIHIGIGQLRLFSL